MCGRYAEFASADDLQQVFDLETAPTLPPRYNIAPTQPAPVVLLDPRGRRTLTLLQWGLVPHWAEDTSMAARMINARSETVAGKPAFRDAFRYRRCIVPCSGFFEWQRTAGAKVPHFIRRRDRRVFGLAGLWESWQAPNGTEVHTYTILTTTPNAEVARLHDRMPVILAPADFARWLEPDTSPQSSPHDLLRPADDGSLEVFPVATRVNTVANDDATLITRQDPPRDPQMKLF